MSPDPVGGSSDNPQSYNPYPYVANNPINNSDPTGMFVFHDSITRKAFSKVSCPKIAENVISFTQKIDRLPGSNESLNSFWHAMSNADAHQSPEAAEIQTDNWIKDNLSLCSVEGLGFALHATQDSYAAGHRGYQPWRKGLTGLPGPIHFANDLLGDTFAAEMASEQLIDEFMEKCPCKCN